MTPESGEKREGPARREFSDGGGLVRLIIGSHVILEKDVDYPFPHIEDTVSRINRALSPLVRRAELVGRLAEMLEEMIHTHGEPCNLQTSDMCDVERRAREALKSWDAIKGDGDA